MTEQHILRHASFDACEDVAMEFSVHEVNDDLESMNVFHTVLARVPFCVTDKRVTIDEDKVEEMGLSCPEYRQYGSNWYEEIDGETFVEHTIGRDFVETPMQAETDVDIVEMEREYSIRHIAQQIRRALENGFFTEDIYGTREEYRQREDEPMIICDDDMDPSEFDESYETVERSYKVGTIRYGVAGVVSNLAWYKSANAKKRSF